MSRHQSRPCQTAACRNQALAERDPQHGAAVRADQPDGGEPTVAGVRAEPQRGADEDRDRQQEGGEQRRDDGVGAAAGGGVTGRVSEVVDPPGRLADQRPDPLVAGVVGELLRPGQPIGAIVPTISYGICSRRVAPPGPLRALCSAGDAYIRWSPGNAGRPGGSGESGASGQISRPRMTLPPDCESTAARIVVRPAGTCTPPVRSLRASMRACRASSSTGVEAPSSNAAVPIATPTAAVAVRIQPRRPPENASRMPRAGSATIRLTGCGPGGGCGRRGPRCRGRRTRRPAGRG